MSQRSVLLPPYLSSNPAWTQLVEAIDEVFNDKIDFPAELLSRLRDNWILTDGAFDKVDLREILDTSNEFYAYERETLIRQANMLGFLFKEADLLTDEDYRRIVRNIGDYWFAKGTPKFIDFLAFCLNAAIKVVKMWSNPGPTYESYGDMLEEGDPAIGTVNWQGGVWYETSHVNLLVQLSTFPPSGLSKLVALFNTLANYDLVLNYVVFEDTTWIHAPDHEIARIVKAYPMIDIEPILLMRPGFLMTEDGDYLSMEDGNRLYMEI